MGEFKEEHGKTKLGLFIQKATKVFPDIAKAGVMLSTGNVMGAIEMVTGKLNANTNHQDPEAQNKANDLLYEFEINKEKMALEALRIKTEGFKLEVDDRKNARTLYSSDSIMQKTFAIVFLLGYGLLSWYLLRILTSTIEMPQLAETMVTMIWTGTSTKLGTIIDFLFGGSVQN